MGNRYYTSDAKRKIKGGPKATVKGPGSSPSIDFKPGPFPGLPGPGQPKDRSMGVQKVKTYNHAEGL